MYRVRERERERERKDSNTAHTNKTMNHSMPQLSVKFCSFIF